MAIGGTISYED